MRALIILPMAAKTFLNRFANVRIFGSTSRNISIMLVSFGTQIRSLLHSLVTQYGVETNPMIDEVAAIIPAMKSTSCEK